MKKLTLLVIATIFFYSCSPPSKLSVDTSCPAYRYDTFERELINNYGIALLPVLGGDDKEQYRRPMGDAIAIELNKTFNLVKSSSQVISGLNDNNLTDEYYIAINNYNTTGIVPREMIKQMGKMLNVRYLLYTKLLADTDSNFSGDIYELYVQSQIWDTNLGDVVWEGKGGFAKFAKNKEFDVVKGTAEGLVNVLGNDVGEGACENTNDLYINTDEYTSNLLLLLGGLSLLYILISVAI